MGLLMPFNTKDNSSIQRLMFTHLRATIWKLCVISVKHNGCWKFTPLQSRSTEVCTLLYMQFYSPTFGGPVQTTVELQVLMCIVITVSRCRSHSFYSSLPLIAWVMLFLTFLCEGVFGTQRAFCLIPQMLSPGRLGLPCVGGSGVPPPPSFQVGNHNECFVFQPSYWHTKDYNNSISKHVLPYKGGSHAGKGPFDTPSEERCLRSVLSGKLDSRRDLPCSLPPVKALKDTFISDTTGYSHVLSGTFPSQRLTQPNSG